MRVHISLTALSADALCAGITLSDDTEAACEQQGRGPAVPDHTTGSAKTVELKVGTGVVITGLASAKELNGNGSDREKGFHIKRANLICCSDQLEEQDIEYNNRRKAAMSSSEGQPCPICLDDMSDDSGGRALACGHRVHRKCWDSMLSAQAKDSSADALTPHCPVCRAWQGGESTAEPTSKRWYVQPPRDWAS